MSTSTIEISREALSNNIKFIRSQLGDGIEISPVIKGNAYGHGIEEIVPIFESLHIRHFSVFSSEEAKRAFGVKKEETSIMIMGYIDEEDYPFVVANNIEHYIFEIPLLKKSLETAKALGKKAIVHLDLETGMHRTGLSKKELDQTVEILFENKEHFIIRGVATHLAGAESMANYCRIMEQLRVFKKRINYLRKMGIEAEFNHTASSAAAITYPQSRMNLVRIGILVYGFWPTRETFIQYLSKKSDKSDPLQRAIRWKSRIMSIKTVKEGEFIGYGFSYQAQNDMKIALVPVGYANGYSRMLSNNGHVLVHSQRANVIGTVNMNMILIDCSHLEKVEIGNEVVLLGKQGANEITVASFAEMNNSMNYELLARLPGNIQRNII